MSPEEKAYTEFLPALYCVGANSVETSLKEQVSNYSKFWQKLFGCLIRRAFTEKFSSDKSRLKQWVEKSWQAYPAGTEMGHFECLIPSGFLTDHEYKARVFAIMVSVRDLETFELDSRPGFIVQISQNFSQERRFGNHETIAQFLLPSDLYELQVMCDAGEGFFVNESVKALAVSPLTITFSSGSIADIHFNPDLTKDQRMLLRTKIQEGPLGEIWFPQKTVTNK